MWRCCVYVDIEKKFRYPLQLGIAECTEGFHGSRAGSLLNACRSYLSTGPQRQYRADVANLTLVNLMLLLIRQLRRPHRPSTAENPSQVEQISIHVASARSETSI